jgi:8-oxo-dGTP diphosphatase
MYCFKCGVDMGTIDFPHTCSCGQTHYRNPIPVAVGLVPAVRRIVGPSGQPLEQIGALLVRRKGGTTDGKLALPGGYVDSNDASLFAAISREIREETAVEIPIDSWRLIDHAKPGPGHLLLFLESSHRLDADSFTSDVPPSDEIYEKAIGFEPMELAFPRHTEQFLRFLHRKGEV